MFISELVIFNFTEFWLHVGYQLSDMYGPCTLHLFGQQIPVWVLWVTYLQISRYSEYIKSSMRWLFSSTKHEFLGGLIEMHIYSLHWALFAWLWSLQLKDLHGNIWLRPRGPQAHSPNSLVLRNVDLWFCDILALCCFSLEIKMMYFSIDYVVIFLLGTLFFALFCWLSVCIYHQVSIVLSSSICKLSIFICYIDHEMNTLFLWGVKPFSCWLSYCDLFFSRAGHF